MSAFPSQLVHTSGARAACLISPCDAGWQELSSQLASKPLDVQTW
jgi:hypothetical protein